MCNKILRATRKISPRAQSFSEEPKGKGLLQGPHTIINLVFFILTIFSVDMMNSYCKKLGDWGPLFFGGSRAIVPLAYVIIEPWHPTPIPVI